MQTAGFISEYLLLDLSSQRMTTICCLRFLLQFWSWSKLLEGLPCSPWRCRYTWVPFTQQYIYIYIYIVLPEQDANTRSIFKRSFTGLNSGFLSSLRLIAIPRLKSAFIYNWNENNWIHTFPEGIGAIWNVNNFRLGFELRSPCPFTNDSNHYTTIASYIYIYIYIWTNWHRYIDYI